MQFIATNKIKGKILIITAYQSLKKRMALKGIKKALFNFNGDRLQIFK